MSATVNGTAQHNGKPTHSIRATMLATPTAKLTTLDVLPDGIPAELCALPQWVCWRWVWRQDTGSNGGKWSKLPIDAQTSKAAKSNDPATWSAFDEAMKRYQACRSTIDGIGFVFAADGGIVGVDLDEAVGPDGQLLEWADEIVSRLGSYTERSPTGTGVKIYLRGHSPGKKNRQQFETGEVEIYDRGRFFCVTGHGLDWTPNETIEQQTAIEELYRLIFEPAEPTTPDPFFVEEPRDVPQDDSALIEKAKAAKNGDKFRRLYEGDTSAHGGDESRADLALCNMVAFWTGPDPARIDRIFRSSGLHRPKWDELRGEKSYGETTIAQALNGRTEYFGDCSNGRRNGNSTNNSPHEHDDTKGTNEATDDPHRLARLYLADHMHEDGLKLCWWIDDWFFWDGRAYRKMPQTELKARIGARIKIEFDRANKAAIEAWERNGQADESGKPKPRPVANKVTVRLVTDTVQALAGMAVLASTVEAPACADPGPWPAGEMLACNNVMVHLPSWADGLSHTHRLTPSFFSMNALDYAFDVKVLQPIEWLRFLLQIWPKDQEAIAALQEWFGYCLLPDTRHHKIFMIVGPKRSGKGTIARILRAMIGILNTGAPTLASLGTNFGLSPMLGKTLAIISDARLSARTDIAVVTERLLSISGEDAQTIDRKHQSHVTAKLPVRFMVMTNELPRLNDPSGALIGRIIILRQTKSFYGMEDTKLTDRLLTELPGILLWAMAGWKRLRERGHFAQPQSGLKIIEELEDLSSPIGAFIRERCEIGPGFEIEVADLFGAWKKWCEGKGRKEPGTEQTFGRDLRAAVAGLDTKQPRIGAHRMRFYMGIRLNAEAAEDTKSEFQEVRF